MIMKKRLIPEQPKFSLASNRELSTFLRAPETSRKINGYKLQSQNYQNSIKTVDIRNSYPQKIFEEKRYHATPTHKKNP